MIVYLVVKVRGGGWGEREGWSGGGDCSAGSDHLLFLRQQVSRAEVCCFLGDVEDEKAVIYQQLQQGRGTKIR